MNTHGSRSTGAGGLIGLDVLGFGLSTDTTYTHIKTQCDYTYNYTVHSYCTLPINVTFSRYYVKAAIMGFCDSSLQHLYRTCYCYQSTFPVTPLLFTRVHKCLLHSFKYKPQLLSEGDSY